MLRQLVDALSDEHVSSMTKSWSNKTLKVATVCSGTDAPILAFKMMLPILKERGIDITMEHVFSCESVPFKRDFITSTTKPPLLFKDVIEIASRGVGECHDGLERAVPDDFTVLIAGTECVDFSSLSTTQRGLHDKGRSGTTFMATLQLVKLKQPPFVILENVAKCPAKEMQEAFQKAGYEAACCRANTADYLLPQSRQRMYFLFTHSKHTRQEVPDMDWASILRELQFERNEESLVWTDFLRDEHAQGASVANRPPKKRKRGGKPLSASQSTKWLVEVKAVEEIEHLTPYDEEGGRPYSAITMNCPELLALPDRAKLRLDVQYKRAVKAGIDPNTTPLPWNPAQQLRFTDSKPWLRKIAPCVTPKHEWIVSSRRAPLTGRECLDLQGIPISDQVAQAFDDAQLRDLAGNAMNTTVVAASCLAMFVSHQAVVCDAGFDRLGLRSNQSLLHS